MKWWRRKPARPADTDPELARIRQELVWKFGEEIAYAIRLTAKDATLIWRPTWPEPLPVDEALQQIDGIHSERFSLLTPIRVEVQPTANGRWLVCTPDEGP